jgi:hypothetical protein
MSDMPPALANAKAQFYVFLRTIAEGEGLTPQQNVVLNSTIMPFDIAADTPFYNDELFREYADRTFSGGVESIQASAAAFMSERFSSQYRAVMNMLTSQIDQNHPELKDTIKELQSEQNDATSDLTTKLNSFDTEWNKIAASRGLTFNTVDYDMQHVTWLTNVRYSDQIQSYTDTLDRINSQIDAVRRKVYSPDEIAALDNYGYLATSYNVARPWQAQLERSYKANGTPLTELMLADPRKMAPAMFDSSPLVFPIGDLIAFLSAQGIRSFDTSTQSYAMDSSTSSWNASGGGSFLGWSLGGGGSGSSTVTHSMTKLSSLSISFANIAEYLADRSAWFNPGVLQDPTMYALVKNRPELNHLQYIAVSLIIARGTTLVLKFSEAVASSDWSQKSFQASGGASWLGFSFGAKGGSSNTNYSVSTNADGTTVTIQDGDTVARVLGVRVEPFVAPPSKKPAAHPLTALVRLHPSLERHLEALKKGDMSYVSFQKLRIAASQALVG